MTASRTVLSTWLYRVATCLLVAMFGTGTLAATVAIDAGQDRIDLSDSMDLLHDPTGRRSFTEVATLGNEFRAASHADLIHSFNAGAFWLRVSLVNSSPQPLTRWLVFGTSKLQLVTLYLQNPGGWQVMSAGLSVPRTQKPIVAGDPAFPITLTPGESREMLLQVDVRGATDMVTTLWEPQAYRMAAGDRNLILAGIIGGILIASMLSLIVSVRLRDSPYAWFSLMLISVAGLEATRENLLGLYLWPADLGFPSQVLAVFAGLVLFSLVKVVVALLDVNNLVPRGDRLLLVMRWTALAGIGVSMINYGNGVRILSVLTLVVLPTSVGLSILGWRRRYPGAREFALAFAFAMLIEVARQLANLGLLPSRVRQLNAQVIDCYEPEFKNVYYNRESCCG